MHRIFSNFILLLVTLGVLLALVYVWEVGQARAVDEEHRQALENVQPPAADAEVQGLAGDSEAAIPVPAGEEALSLSLGGVTVGLGDGQTQVESLLGPPDRVDPTPFAYDWHVYNRDYSRFLMVGVQDGYVVALYTNAKGFEAAGVSYGDPTEESPGSGIKYYYDSLGGTEKTVHACLITAQKASITWGEGFDPAVYRAQELESLDTTNVFRVNHGLAPLTRDQTAAGAALAHAVDMAEHNYFSHTSLNGLSFFDRYLQQGGNAKGGGENLYAGELLAIETIDGWINSQGHRENVLEEQFTGLGVGFAYQALSDYHYYMAQTFVAK